MKRIVYFLICIMGLYSCHRKQESSSLKTIFVNTDSVVGNISFSDLFSKAEYIPLETSEECLIGNISKIIYYNETFYIADETAKCVFIFDKCGKFVSKIGSVGRGPGEYLDLSNIFIDEAKQQLIIDADHKYQIYDLKTRKLIKEKRYVVDGCEKGYLGDECFASYLDYEVYGGNTKNVVIEQGGNVLSSYFPVEDYLKGCACAYGFVYSLNEQGGLFLAMPLNDTIYTVERAIISPYCYIDFGDKKLPHNYMKNAPKNNRLSYLNKSPYFKGVMNFVETGNYIYFSFSGDNSRLYNYFYFKKRQKKYLYRSIIMDENGVAPPWSPSAFYGNDFYVSELSAENASFFREAIIKRATEYPLEAAEKEKAKKVFNSRFFEKYNVMVDSMTEDSNPVLIILHLKLEE